MTDLINEFIAEGWPPEQLRNLKKRSACLSSMWVVRESIRAIEKRLKRSWNNTQWRSSFDTNILLYAENRGRPEDKFCLDFLRGMVASGNTCFVPENIIYEFLRVATHPRVFPLPCALRKRLFFWTRYSPFQIFRVLGATERHWSSLRDLIAELGELS
jgi:predicted nucleic acid-binding protein